MKRTYGTEMEGMIDFYAELGIQADYSCNTDGRVDGTLVEFKRDDNRSPDKQLKRYIGSYNVAALPIPQYSLFININPREYRFYDNENWDTDNKLEMLDDGKWVNPEDLLKFLDRKNYMLGKINEFSIINYNDKFYDGHISSKKDDFIKEIQNPRKLHIEPYTWNKTGDMERDILDCLGGKQLQKRLGAFFTPDEYVNISTAYLRNRIESIPKGYDYVILDRCAGTGNLEKYLTPEELSHCILNTYVYAEWTTLKGLYEDRVRCIIPHTKDYKDPDGLLSDGDALTEKFDKIIIDIIEIERKKAGGKLVVIGLENPPYSEPQAEAARGGKTYKQSSWVKEQMKKSGNIKGAATNDLANQFIWSMLQFADEYIIFAPIKYWKSQHLFDGQFNEGYLCNRKKFHTTSEAAISLISWTINDNKNDCLLMKSDEGDRKVKKIHKGVNSFGFKKLSIKKTYSGVAYMSSTSGTPDFKHGVLRNDKLVVNFARNPVALAESNILQTLPLWVANCYKSKDYTEKEVIMKSGDGGVEYQKDIQFLNDCFVWSCLTANNKCVSNNETKNELCLDQSTEADKLLVPDKRNKLLLIKWIEIIKEIKTTSEYNSDYTYGLHQIKKDINIQIESGSFRKNGDPIMKSKYPTLDDLIKELNEMLKVFYNKYITPKLFKYELLK